MAELLANVAELHALPEEVHWFCPRSGIHDQNTYDQDDLQNLSGDGNPDPDLLRRLNEAEQRRKLVSDALQLLAYDGEDVAQYQDWLKDGLDKQMGRCEICAREYHKGKKRLLEDLRRIYQDEDVATFFKILDDRDFERIKAGLQTASVNLKSAPPQDRSLVNLDLPAMFAFFEALNCEAFLKDEGLLISFFDEPFSLLQSSKTLKLREMLPATGWFLFTSNETRHRWAMQSWTRLQRNLTKTEFEWVVREPLSQEMTRASNGGLDLNSCTRFWCGAKLIVEKLDRDLIIHSLRELPVDICRLALEHLQFNTAGLRFLLHTIRTLFEKSPDQFWDAMGAISPTAVIEQVFSNPQFESYIAGADSQESFDTSALRDMLSWIEPFMASLKPANQPPACRSLVSQLIDRFQSDQYPEYSRLHCYQVGLSVLAQTIRNFSEEKSAIGSVGRVVVSDTLDVVNSHVAGLIRVIDLPADSSLHRAAAGLCTEVIRNALSLECKSLKADHEALEAGQALQHGASSYSSTLWLAVVDSLNPDSMSLAKTVLMGVVPLVGLEKFKTNNGGALVKEKIQFNNTYSNLTHLVSRVLERLNDFSAQNLDDLYRFKDTASSLIAALFSADPTTYQGAVELLKTVSGEFGRREAIGHLLKAFFTTSVDCISWSLHCISNKKTFASLPRMLKTCTDVFDVLCNPQDGILRRRPLSFEEVRAVESLWKRQWRTLVIIFETTEQWSRQGNDKNAMADFCRDTMQFAETVFDHYGALASAIDTAGQAKQNASLVESGLKPAGKQLLEEPRSTLNAMVKWLRLRDEYLATTLVKLVCRLFRRLGEQGMTIPDEALAWVRKVAVTRELKTTLSDQSKVELTRAIQQHEDQAPRLPIARSEPSKRQGTIDSWAQSVDPTKAVSSVTIQAKRKEKSGGVIDLEAWRSKARSQADVADPDDLDDFGSDEIPDKDILELSQSVERLKAQQQSRRPTNITSRSIIPKPPPRIGGVDPSFREKRQKEREEKRQRDALELARMKRHAIPTGVAEQTAGEGSGLRGLGVKGKDHAPQGPSMMVSSDSESDSDMDELDKELFGRSKGSKTSAAFKEYQKSKDVARKQAQAQGPVKKRKQIRSAKDMRARLKPDLSPLHRTILGWEFFHEGAFPPNSERHDYSLVSNTFRTPSDYQGTFEPLLVLEAWQGFLKAKEEGNLKPFEIKVVNRLTVDSFIELSTTMSMAEGKDLGVGEADIILISKGQSPVTEQQQPHCLARVFSITRKKNVLEISYRLNPNSPLVPLLAPEAIIRGVKISSITPLEREYAALCGLQYYDLCDEIIKAKPSPLLNYQDKQLESIVNIYNVNIAQAKAVKSATENDAFTLIQGPPGSGKTKTITAIVGAILTNTLGDKGVAITRPQQTNGLNLPPSAEAAPRKLLVCAPSNAAVDELVMRFKQGVKTLKGEDRKLSLVRIGRSDAINASVLDVTLEELVQSKLNLANGNQQNLGESINKIMMAHKAASEELRAAFDKYDEARKKGEPAAEFQREIEILKRKKTALSNQIDSSRDSGRAVARDAEISRRRAQQEILDGADVICATLSGSGHDMFQGLKVEFETVIIDEAAQAIELSALIPLKYGCSKCILVGDPKQLPPTVLSREAARFQYEQSLFVRMQSNHPKDVHLLDTQYRMHPEISAFPSKAFYDGKLLDGNGMAKLRIKPWHSSNILGPYRFFDVQGQHQSAPKGHSLINVAELNAALQLYERLTTDFRSYDFKGKVGIITPYKSQLRELRSRFGQRYGDAINDAVEFNTTDAFQGRESEIIIFSCVRASSQKGIGFLADIRRMNVGLTRAKCSLWVLGNSQSLIQGEFWGDLIRDTKRRGLYTSGDLMALLRKPTLVSASPVDNRIGTTDEDVEMTDAPAPSRPVSARSNSSSAAQPSKIKAVVQPEPACFKPQEGSDKKNTGQKDPNLNGSGSRVMKEAGAIPANASRCFRCGDINHIKSRCFTPRCLSCGEYGHLADTCVSVTRLSKSTRSQIEIEERLHARLLGNLAEKAKVRQLGDHDPRVPKIQSTRKTPPLTEEGIRKKAQQGQRHNVKRRREPSPPEAPVTFKPESATATAARPPPKPNAPVTANSSSLNGPESASNGHRITPSSRPAPGSRGPPPPKKKKEADPFIRPNKRRPRP